MSYAIVKLKLRAEIGGINFPDVARYGATFAMNQIPTGMLMVAVGRSTKDDNLATIHRLGQLTTAPLPVKVYLTAFILAKDNADAGMPHNTELLIFEGETAASGWRRTYDNAHVTIPLLHWLANLDYASAISASSHPGNPGNWTYPATYALNRLIQVPQAGGLGPRPSWIPIINDADIPSASLADIWGLVIHRWMIERSQDDSIDPRLTAGAPPGPDPLVTEALSRIGPNPDGAPLDLELTGIDATIIAKGISQALVNESGSSWLNTTLWGKLVGDWAPAYWFSVIPRVRDALIVPFTGGLRGAPWAVLGNEDNAQVEINLQQHRILRAVGIVHTAVISFTGANNFGQTIPELGGLCGFYQPPGVTRGMIMLKDAPKWVSNPLLAHDWSNASAGVPGNAIIGNALDEAGAVPAPPVPPNPGAVQADYRKIMDKYAQQWYAIEALKGRIGELSGKLRFDVAPGSNVRIAATTVKHIDAQDSKLERTLFATVLQVAYVIDAEGQQAGTAFTLAHVRTETENTLDRTSVVKPPLYRRTWRGARLIPEVEVETT